MEALISRRCKAILEDVENCARNIYYAMSYLPNDSKARANLQVALDMLGVKSPQDVGLSAKAGIYNE